MQVPIIAGGRFEFVRLPSCLADMHGGCEVMQTIILRFSCFFQQALVKWSSWSKPSHRDHGDELSKHASQRELGLAFSLDKSVLVSGRSTAEPQRSEGYTALSRHGNFQKHGCLSIGWMQTKPWGFGVDWSCLAWRSFSRCWSCQWFFRNTSGFPQHFSRHIRIVHVIPGGFDAGARDAHGGVQVARLDH